jgi:hypothetical protein
MHAPQTAARLAPADPQGTRESQDPLGRALADGRVAASAIFHGGRMTMSHDAVPDPHAQVTFKDADALWTFLTSKSQDILGCILENKVNLSRLRRGLKTMN